MKNIYLDIEDKVLRQSFYDLFSVFGFKFTDKNKADFVVKDLDDRISVNGDKFFTKPVDIFSMISELSQSTDLYFGKLCLKVKKKIAEFNFEGEIKETVESELSKIAEFNEKTVALTDIETKILSSLMSNKDGISNLDLSIAVFAKANESCLKSLVTHLYNLKKKIETITGKQKNIILENSKYFLDL